VKLEVLGQKADAGAHRALPERRAEHAAHTAGRFDKTEQQLERGCLAGALGPRKPNTSPPVTEQARQIEPLEVECIEALGVELS
jgi:hypothetical protein